MTQGPRPDPRPLVIGVGTEHRRDDRCGLDVVRALRSRVGDAVRIEETSADATRLLDLWEGEEDVHVVDGVRSSSPPGTCRIMEVVTDLNESGTPTSTHGLSLADAIALGRALGRMPKRLTLHTIEISDVAVGDGLTAPVAAAVELLVEGLVGRARPAASAPGERWGGPPHA